jgi:resuscitation-promoting factor RpfB
MNGVERSDPNEAVTTDGVHAPVARWSLGWRAMLLAVLTVLAGVGLLVALAWGYMVTATSVTVTVDGMTASLLTHQPAVGDLLSEMELKLAPEDHLVPAASTPLTPGLAITIHRARPVLVHVDGRSRTVLTHAATVGAVLTEAGVAVGQHDPISLDSAPATLKTVLPKVDIIRKRNFPGLPGVYPWRGARLDPLQIDLERAVSLRVRIRGANGQGDEEQATIWSTATTVGEALEQEGLTIYEGDLVQPALGQPLVAGLAVTIERSKPVVLSTAAHTLVIRTRGATVADLLAEQGLVLVGLDRVEPTLSTPLTDDLAVRVTRVQRAYEIEEEVTPYTAVWEPDPELEIDNQRLDQEGVNGITRHRYRIVLEDNQPISRTLEDTWLAQVPVTKVLKYGAKIELRTVDTPQGALTYWRKIRMYATSYSADEAGTPRDAPWYGRTRTGRKIQYGVAAVDPAIVRLGSKVFVPGYGVADAADTGSAVKGRWIDVAFDEGKLVPWSRCVDVYLLAPAPPDYLIQHILPKWPKAPCLYR